MRRAPRRARGSRRVVHKEVITVPSRQALKVGRGRTSGAFARGPGRRQNVVGDLNAQATTRPAAQPTRPTTRPAAKATVPTPANCQGAAVKIAAAAGTEGRRSPYGGSVGASTRRSAGAFRRSAEARAMDEVSRNLRTTPAFQGTLIGASLSAV